VVGEQVGGDQHADHERHARPASPALGVRPDEAENRYGLGRGHQQPQQHGRENNVPSDLKRRVEQMGGEALVLQPQR